MSEEDRKLLEEVVRKVVREELNRKEEKENDEKKQEGQQEGKAYSECTGCGHKFKTKAEEDLWNYCPECGAIETRKL